MDARLYLDIFGYYLPAAVGILCFLFGAGLLLSNLEKMKGQHGQGNNAQRANR